MTQTLIEKLEALPRKRLEDRPANPLQMIHDLQKHGLNMPLRGREYIDFADLRAIIEDAKAEKQEPVCNKCKGSGEIGGSVCHGMNDYSYETINCPDCNGTGEPPDIFAELVKALDDDAYAATFQSMAGYRTALIAKVKGVVG